MSGHSKWSSIKRQKGINDKLKGKNFTKLGKAITIAVKEGGGTSDPASNFRLRLAIDAARTSNMPKENIERAIKRASEKDAGEMSEVIYEGFAPGGISIIVEAITDNTMRTTPEVKNLFTKSGGSFGQPGSAAYLFKHMGRIIAKKGDKTFDQIFESAVENGAEDIEEVGEEAYIYTQVSDLSKVRDALTATGVEIVEADLTREAINKIEEADEEKLGKIEKFINALEEMDDVQKVFTNLL